MKATIEFKGKYYNINLNNPIDISLPIEANENNPIAWYLEQPLIQPVIAENFIGSVASGKSSTNFNTITFNPHGHGTHTECLGHITKDFYSINKHLKTFFFFAQVITVKPKLFKQDLVIDKFSIKTALNGNTPQALIIRTLPNDESKKHAKYSNTNFPYLLEESAEFIKSINVEHLLIDLPSVDKENDQGKLLSHKAFWNVKDVHNLNNDARLQATITEMVYLNQSINDGFYFLNLQIASFENDASPSKPILYAIEAIK